MGAVYDIVQVAATVDTAPYTQTITASLGGLTPKAAMCFISRTTANSTTTDHHLLQKGFYDGTDAYSVAIAGRDGVGTSETYSLYDEAFIVALLDPTTGSGATDGTANLSGGGLTTNGITINWTEAPGAAYLMTWVFFAGSDMTAKVIRGRNITTGATAQAVGFNPELVLFAATASNSASGTIGTESRLSLGVSDGTVHRCTTHRDDGGVAVAATVVNVSTSKVLEILGTGSITDSLAASGFDSDGFDLTATSDWTNRNFGFLALTTGGVASFNIQNYTTPSSADSSHSLTGVGFTPDTVILLQCLLTSRDSVGSAGTSSTVGLSVFSATDEYAAQATNQDGETNMNSHCRTANRVSDMVNGARTLTAGADFVSMDSGAGYTLDHVTATGARVWTAISFEGVAEAAGGQPRMLTLLGVG